MKFAHWPHRFLRHRRDNSSMPWEAQGYWKDLFPCMQVKLNNMLSQDRCNACKGVYHEATGHRHSEKTVLCGPCARHYLKWVKGHTNRRWGKVRFYDHASRPSKESK